jgi:hypothetical protein
VCYVFPGDIAPSVIAGQGYGPQFYPMATVMLFNFENFAYLVSSTEPRMVR